MGIIVGRACLLAAALALAASGEAQAAQPMPWEIGLQPVVGGAGRIVGRQHLGTARGQVEPAERQTGEQKERQDRHEDGDRAAHHLLRHAVPEAAFAGRGRAAPADRDRVDAVTEDGQQGGEEGQAVDEGEGDDDHPGLPHRAERRQREESSRCESLVVTAG